MCGWVLVSIRRRSDRCTVIQYLLQAHCHGWGRRNERPPDQRDRRLAGVRAGVHPSAGVVRLRFASPSCEDVDDMTHLTASKRAWLHAADCPVRT